MRIIRVTILGLFYSSLIIRKVLLFFLLPILALSLFYNVILFVKSNPMAVLFACCSIVIAIEMFGTSSKPSSKDLDLSFYPHQEYHSVPPCQEEHNTQKEDVYGRDLIMLEVVSDRRAHCSKSYSEGGFDSIFNRLPLEYVETNEGKGFRREINNYYDDDEIIEEFCPRLVCVEYYKEKQVDTAASSTLSLAAPEACIPSTAVLTTKQMMYYEKVVRGYDHVDNYNDLSIGAFHGGYGEDDEIEEKRDHLERRIEEFIEKNNEKWKEDRLNENLLYYEPAEWQFAVAG